MPINRDWCLSFIWIMRRHMILSADPSRRLIAVKPYQNLGGPPYPAFGGTVIYMAFQPIRFTLPACHHTATWAFTSHFHPYPALRRDGYFLWYSLLPGCSRPGTFPLGSMAPCVVPTFLPVPDKPEQSDKPDCCCAAKVLLFIKVRWMFQKYCLTAFSGFIMKH